MEWTSDNEIALLCEVLQDGFLTLARVRSPRGGLLAILWHHRRESDVFRVLRALNCAYLSEAIVALTVPEHAMEPAAGLGI
jgi:hypothetical protein